MKKSQSSRPFRAACRLFCGVLPLLWGCGDASLAPAGGAVQAEGQPVTGGKVVLTPTGGGPAATGEIQADGRFNLMTHKPGDGATIGQHHVTVVGKRETEDGEPRRTYLAPQDFRLEVHAGQPNEFLIDIRRETGWIQELEE